MESNADVAIKASNAAGKRFKANDMYGAPRMVLKAQSIVPALPGLTQLLGASIINDGNALLGLDASSEEDKIKKQFKKMYIFVHPNKNSSAAAGGAFKLLRETCTFRSPHPPLSTGEPSDMPEIQRSMRYPRGQKKVRCFNNGSVVKCEECVSTANPTTASTPSTQPCPPNPFTPSVAAPPGLRRRRVECTHCSTGFHREVIASRGLLLHCRHCRKWFIFKVEADGDRSLYSSSQPAFTPFLHGHRALAAAGVNSGDV